MPLITLIVSLAMPGRIARIACGRTMRRRVRNGPMPKRGRREALVAVDRQDAAANDLGAEGRLVQREAKHRGGECIELIPKLGSASKRKTSCNSGGVPRTNQM